MSPNPSETFTEAARSVTKPKKLKRPAPFPVRFSAEERAYLERKAGNQPLGSYIRRKLLGDMEVPRKAGSKPSIDRVALAQILGLMGKSEQVSCLFLLLAAAEVDRVAMAEADRAALHEACANIREMRSLLIGGLGLRSGDAL